MNTLSLLSAEPGITYNERTAVRGFAVIDTLASITGRVPERMQGSRAGGASLLRLRSRGA